VVGVLVRKARNSLSARDLTETALLISDALDVQRNRLTHLQGDVHTTVAGAECGFPAPDSNPGNNRNTSCALVDFKSADFMDGLGFVMHDCARVDFA
jgi:hypothetical protein